MGRSLQLNALIEITTERDQGDFVDVNDEVLVQASDHEGDMVVVNCSLSNHSEENLQEKKLIFCVDHRW